MADPLLGIFQSTLPLEIKDSILEHVESLRQGQFQKILEHPLTKLLLGWTDDDDSQKIQCEKDSAWSDWIFRRLGVLVCPSKESETAFRRHFFFLVGLASLQAFVQSNVTGPPLAFKGSEVLWPDSFRDSHSISDERQTLVNSLAVDGIAAYRLTPNIELFCLADTILTSPSIKKNVAVSPWLRLRLDFLHQRLLAETSSTLQQQIYDAFPSIDQLVHRPESPDQAPSFFLVERASIYTHHGKDGKAREDLDAATTQRPFSFALTGKLGKRTKWQERDTSQLLVLARSHQAGDSVVESDDLAKPANLELNDDTLLEGIAFTGTKTSSTDVKAEDSLPEDLRQLEPGSQPRLEPLDSVILLQLASSITNTAPADGLTREETLPYAARVLEGGAANWQVYTQALLVRSRIDGFRSRTTERGLLQLQALVDQVVADTSTSADGDATTFLPRATEKDAAPASERLAFVYALAAPTRRQLEAELAQRWAGLGGLRSALDIYERLEMWAEAALCWAATDREDRARAVIRRQLNHPTAGPDAPVADPDAEKWLGPPRDPAPSDAPRLYCILGDIDADAEMYDAAWRVSGQRYARAQRSLGRLFWQKHDFAAAAAAYELSLTVGGLNGASWFALGCCRLELAQFDAAVDAFMRTVQLDETDAEAWSNLAVSLLKRGPRTTSDSTDAKPALDDDADTTSQQTTQDPQAHTRDALRAFRRAATLKHDSPKIWDNVLTAAASLSPPSFPDLLTAQSRLIDLTSKSAGESSIDPTVLDALVRHVVATYPSAADIAAGAPAPRPGSLAAQTASLVTTRVAPLVTRSTRLWRCVATIARWQGRPAAALDAEEKAWRAATGPGVGEWDDKEKWEEAVDATEALVAAYESLGGMERTEGLGAGSGEVVARDWRFKARSAIRGIMGRGKETWEGSEGWERLAEALQGLKVS